MSGDIRPLFLFVDLKSACAHWACSKQNRNLPIGIRRTDTTLHLPDHEQGRPEGIDPIWIDMRCWGGSGQSRRAQTHRAEERCRRPTGSGTGGIRISPPGVGDSYRDTSDSDATGQTGLACDQFGRLARAFRVLDRDGILVPAVRFDVRAARAAAIPSLVAAIPCAAAIAAPTPASKPVRDAPEALRRAPHCQRSIQAATP